MTSWETCWHGYCCHLIPSKVLLTERCLVLLNVGVYPKWFLGKSHDIGIYIYIPKWFWGKLGYFSLVSFLYRSFKSVIFSCQVFDGDEGRWKTTTMLQAFLVPGGTAVGRIGGFPKRKRRPPALRRSLFWHLLPAELVHLGPKGADDIKVGSGPCEWL